MSPNDADGMANSLDPDQTAPLGAVWSGSALFAQAYLSENLGSLQYVFDSFQDYLTWTETKQIVNLVRRIWWWTNSVHCLHYTQFFERT